MSRAFKCDVCDQLEEGHPAQSLLLKPKHGGNVELELCSACLVSLSDWRVMRAPKHDQPHTTSADAPFKVGE